MVVQSRNTINTYFIFFIEIKWAETLLLVTKIELTLKLYSLVLGLHSDDTRGESPGAGAGVRGPNQAISSVTIWAQRCSEHRTLGH